MTQDLAVIEREAGLLLPVGARVVEHAVSRASIDPVFFWMVEVPSDGAGLVRSSIERHQRSPVTIAGGNGGFPAWWAPCAGDDSLRSVFEFGGAVIRVYVCEKGERARLFIERITY